MNLDVNFVLVGCFWVRLFSQGLWKTALWVSVWSWMAVALGKEPKVGVFECEMEDFLCRTGGPVLQVEATLEPCQPPVPGGLCPRPRKTFFDARLRRSRFR